MSMYAARDLRTIVKPYLEDAYQLMIVQLNACMLQHVSTGAQHARASARLLNRQTYRQARSLEKLLLKSTNKNPIQSHRIVLTTCEFRITEQGGEG